jgi:hypothetical protein
MRGAAGYRGLDLAKIMEEEAGRVFSVKLECAGNYWAANENGKHCNYGGKCIFYIAMAAGDDT